MISDHLKMLDVLIYHHLVMNKMGELAEQFREEASINPDDISRVRRKGLLMDFACCWTTKVDELITGRPDLEESLGFPILSDLVQTESKTMASTSGFIDVIQTKSMPVMPPTLNSPDLLQCQTPTCMPMPGLPSSRQTARQGSDVACESQALMPNRVLSNLQAGDATSMPTQEFSRMIQASSQRMMPTPGTSNMLQTVNPKVVPMPAVSTMGIPSFIEASSPTIMPMPRHYKRKNVRRALLPIPWVPDTAQAPSLAPKRPKTAPFPSFSQTDKASSLALKRPMVKIPRSYSSRAAQVPGRTMMPTEGLPDLTKAPRTTRQTPLNLTMLSAPNIPNRLLSSPTGLPNQMQTQTPSNPMSPAPEIPNRLPSSPTGLPNQMQTPLNLTMLSAPEIPNSLLSSPTGLSNQMQTQTPSNPTMSPAPEIPNRLLSSPTELPNQIQTPLNLTTLSAPEIPNMLLSSPTELPNQMQTISPGIMSTPDAEEAKQPSFAESESNRFGSVAIKIIIAAQMHQSSNQAIFSGKLITSERTELCFGLFALLLHET